MGTGWVGRRRRSFISGWVEDLRSGSVEYERQHRVERWTDTTGKSRRRVIYLR